jgi:phytoene desaturase
MEWVFDQLGEPMDEHLELHRITRVYEVASGHRPPVQIDDSLEETIAEFERRWPGSGDAYQRFIDVAWSVYRRLQPLQRISQVSMLSLLRSGAWRDATYLWRSLDDVLQRTRLPQPVRDALGIWSHIAGHSMHTAPAPLAFVPALIHRIGAWYPINGIGQIPRSLAQIATQAGVKFHFETQITAIQCDSGTARGIETEQGESIALTFS